MEDSRRDGKHVVWALALAVGLAVAALVLWAQHTPARPDARQRVHAPLFDGP